MDEGGIKKGEILLSGRVYKSVYGELPGSVVGNERKVRRRVKFLVGFGATVFRDIFRMIRLSWRSVGCF